MYCSFRAEAWELISCSLVVTQPCNVIMQYLYDLNLISDMQASSVFLVILEFVKGIYLIYFQPGILPVSDQGVFMCQWHIRIV